MTNPYGLVRRQQRVPDAVRRRRAVPRGERLGTVLATGIRLRSGGDDVRTDAPGAPDGVTTSTEISPEELQLSQRNHGMQLEGLRYDVTPAGMHYLLIHFDVPEADERPGALSVGGLVRRPARALDRRPPIAAERDDAGHDGVRRQRSGAALAPADLAALDHRGDRDRRVDRHAVAPDPRGGRARGRRGRARLPRRRSRDPGRRRTGLRAQPDDRGRDARRGAPRVRDERCSAARPARVPAPVGGAGVVRDDEREVALRDRGRGRTLPRFPDGVLPLSSASRGRRRAGHPDEPARVARPAGVPGVPDARSDPRRRAARGARARLVRVGADRPGRGQRGRRCQLGGGHGRRTDVALRLGPVDLHVGRRARRVRAVLPRHGRRGQHPADPSSRGTCTASRTTWSSACRSRFDRPRSVRADRAAPRSSGRCRPPC